MDQRSAAASLMGKLSGLELDDGEAELLSEVFRRAHDADGEVTGFSAPKPADDPFSRGLFPSRNVHGLPKQFKGSDEELQIIDWLGSLELRR